MVSVSEVLHVKPKRHRGFNTVPDDKKFDNKKEKREVKKETQETTQVKEKVKDNEPSEWDDIQNSLEPSKETTESPKTGGKGWDDDVVETNKETESPKTTGKDQKEETTTSGNWDSPKEPRKGRNQQNWDNRSQGQGRNQNRNPKQQRRIDIESTQQFPPLSGTSVPQEKPIWNHGGQNN